MENSLYYEKNHKLRQNKVLLLRFVFQNSFVR